MRKRSPLNNPGIYTVTNTVSGTVYVGQARNIRKRWEVHRCTLENDKHRNGYLQRAWNKYGAGVFRFEVLVDLSHVLENDLAARLNEEEIAALRRFSDTYNLMEAGRSGTIASETTRQLWSQQRVAIWADPVLRERIVSAMKKRAADPAHQKRRGTAIAAYRNQPEIKAAVSEHMTKLWADPQHRTQQSAIRKKNWQDARYRAQQAESRSATWQDPEIREKRRAGMRAAWVRRKAAAAQAELPGT